MGHTASFFPFFFKKEPVALMKAVPFKPVVPAETLQACALLGLHLLAAEGEAGSSGGQSPYLGDMWKYGCRKSLGWITPLTVRCTSTTTSASPVEVIGQDWSSEVVSLFLEDWELGRVALSCT